jgi:hypothetical protein
MFEIPPDERSFATAGASRTAELARGGSDPMAERRDGKRRASAKAPQAPSLAEIDRVVPSERSPHNVQPEQALLGAVLINIEPLGVVEELMTCRKSRA